jgi:hypothetical protein
MSKHLIKGSLVRIKGFQDVWVVTGAYHGFFDMAPTYVRCQLGPVSIELWYEDLEVVQGVYEVY